MAEKRSIHDQCDIPSGQPLMRLCRAMHVYLDTLLDPACKTGAKLWTGTTQASYQAYTTIIGQPEAVCLVTCITFLCLPLLHFRKGRQAMR